MPLNQSFFSVWNANSFPHSVDSLRFAKFTFCRWYCIYEKDKHRCSFRNVVERHHNGTNYEIMSIPLQSCIAVILHMHDLLYGGHKISEVFQPLAKYYTSVHDQIDYSSQKMFLPLLKLNGRTNIKNVFEKVINRPTVFELCT